MNLLRFLLLFPACIGGFISLQGQSSVYLKDGSSLHSKHITLTFQNLSFFSEGEFYHDSSTMLFQSGDEGSDLFLSGAGDFSLSKLQLQMRDQSLILESDVEIKDGLNLSEGNLFLNQHTIFLTPGNAEIQGEGESARILGEGIIEKQVSLSYPEKESPGNLGMSISAQDVLGQSVLRRIQKSTLDDSLKLIYRQYEIETAFSPKSPMRLHVTYHTTDNPFGKDAHLIPVQETKDSWREMAFYQEKAHANSLEVALGEGKKSWHIGLSPEKALGNIREAEKMQDFHLYPNPFTNFVFLQWEDQDETPISIQVCDAAGHQVFVKKLQAFAQETLIEEIPNIPAGVYLVKITTNKGYAYSRSLLHTE